jgi:hypothetical protein
VSLVGCELVLCFDYVDLVLNVLFKVHGGHVSTGYSGVQYLLGMPSLSCATLRLNERE